MGLEIERKFLVKEIPPGRPMRITQGYLSQDPERTVRVRVYTTGVRNRISCSQITIKGKSTPDGLSRSEWEYKIPVDEGLEMLKLCTGVIDKTRYHLMHDEKLWEIDVFHGDNRGLVVAEVELSSEDESIILPAWITQEVTGDPKYYNSNLIQNPYKDW